MFDWSIVIEWLDVLKVFIAIVLTARISMTLLSVFGRAYTEQSHDVQQTSEQQQQTMSIFGVIFYPIAALYSWMDTFLLDEENEE